MLDGHVDVLKLDPLRHAVALELGPDCIQSAKDRCGVVLAQNTLIAQHGGMCLRSGNVLTPQALVEADRSVDLRHQLGGLAAEAATPRLLAFDLVGHGSGVAMHGTAGQTGALPTECEYL